MNKDKKFFADLISDIMGMSSKDRNILLCQLVVKEHTNTISPLEQIQLTTIQYIRKLDGEIDQVLKSWAENPDLDPRIDIINTSNL